MGVPGGHVFFVAANLFSRKSAAKLLQNNQICKNLRPKIKYARIN